MADPQDERRRLLLPAKNNLAAKPLGFAYRIVDGVVSWEPGRVSQRADDVLRASNDRRPGRTNAVDEAAKFLRKTLENGPVSKKTIGAEAHAAGFKEVTIRRAKDKLGIKAQERLRRRLGVGAARRRRR